MSQYLSSAAVMARRRVNYHGYDYYPTPPYATEALIGVLKKAYGIDRGLLSSMSCLEPAAGGGHMVDVLAQYFGSVDGTDIIDPESRGWGGVDFLTCVAPDPERRHDWLITNPPFKLADQFIQRAPQFARNYAMLARLSLLEGIGRYQKIWSKRPPSTVAIFVKRLMMVEGRLPRKGESSAVCYAWFVWSQSQSGDAIMFIAPHEGEEDYEREQLRFGNC